MVHLLIDAVSFFMDAPWIQKYSELFDGEQCIGTQPGQRSQTFWKLIFFDYTTNPLPNHIYHLILKIEAFFNHKSLKLFPNPLWRHPLFRLVSLILWARSFLSSPHLSGIQSLPPSHPAEDPLSPSSLFHSLQHCRSRPSQPLWFKTFLARGVQATLGLRHPLTNSAPSSNSPTLACSPAF